MFIAVITNALWSEKKMLMKHKMQKEQKVGDESGYLICLWSSSSPSAVKSPSLIEQQLARE